LTAQPVDGIIALKFNTVFDSYQEWWRDWPDETRQPAETQVVPIPAGRLVL